jgi:hypothetical protein
MWPFNKKEKKSELLSDSEIASIFAGKPKADVASISEVTKKGLWGRVSVLPTVSKVGKEMKEISTPGEISAYKKIGKWMIGEMPSQVKAKKQLIKEVIEPPSKRKYLREAIAGKLFSGAMPPGLEIPLKIVGETLPGRYLKKKAIQLLYPTTPLTYGIEGLSALAGLAGMGGLADIGFAGSAIKGLKGARLAKGVATKAIAPAVQELKLKPTVAMKKMRQAIMTGEKEFLQTLLKVPEMFRGKVELGAKPIEKIRQTIMMGEKKFPRTPEVPEMFRGKVELGAKVPEMFRGKVELGAKPIEKIKKAIEKEILKFSGK